MSEKPNYWFLFKGKSSEDMTRKELLEVIEYLSAELERQHKFLLEVTTW